MLLLFLYFVAILTSVFLLLIRYRKIGTNLPPGPPKFPIIGSLLSVLLEDPKRPVVAFQKLGKKYGPIFSLQLGTQPVVVINSHEEILKGLNTDESIFVRTDEKDAWILEKNNSKELGIIFSNNTFWSETRATSHRILRKYGFNTKAKTEGIILEEITEFCEELKKGMSNGQLVIRLTSQFSFLFFNIVCTLLTGKKYEGTNMGTRRLLSMMDDFVTSGQVGGSIAQIYPSLLTLFPNVTGFTQFKEMCVKWREGIKEVVDEARLEGRYKENPNSFLEEYLQKVDTPIMEKLEAGTHNIFTEDNLVAILQDLKIAGTETLSNIMKFTVRYLVYFPEIQKNLQIEMEEIVGRTRLVNSEDIPRLVYMQAVMFEVFRHSTVVVALPRRVTQNTKFGKYDLPKGTLVIHNIYAGDKDESVWSEPTKFLPGRFLSKDSTLINTEKILSFGGGKRRCLGEQLAKTSLLLVLATLIQQFSFHEDPRSGMPPNEEIHGFTLHPVTFGVILKSREHEII